MEGQMNRAQGFFAYREAGKIGSPMARYEMRLSLKLGRHFRECR
jgi:hypothetical protein